MTEENNTPEAADSPEARIKELEYLLSEKNAEIGKLKKAVEEMSTSLTAARAGFTEAMAGYRELLVSGHPEIDPEMVNGETIKALKESLAAARNLVAGMRRKVLEELTRSRVPAGAPGRLPPDLAGLSPREKIKYGVGGKQ